MFDFKFEILNSSLYSRRGRIFTAHGMIETPCFMPVGTAATVKAMTNNDLIATCSQIILSNTYHLMLRPTAERIALLGGLHKFMNWHGPILTDSGGFQVMSLSQLRQINEQGVSFRSHIDGSLHHLTPERSIQIQHLLDSDITMCFDECIKLPASWESVKKSMELSLRWAQRSKNAYINRFGYGIFGIVQGGTYADLRMESLNHTIAMNFDGYAIGGLAVGETQDAMFEVLSYTAQFLPKNKPRYLMGVGKPSDIYGAVQRGVDMFDCVLPSRSGRNGQAFVRGGTINIRNAQYSTDVNPLDIDCRCYTCTHHTKGYLHHLVRSKEILGAMLMTQHNIYYYNDLMHAIRIDIENNTFNNNGIAYKMVFNK